MFNLIADVSVFLFTVNYILNCKISAKLIAKRKALGNCDLQNKILVKFSFLQHLSLYFLFCLLLFLIPFLPLMLIAAPNGYPRSVLCRYNSLEFLSQSGHLCC